MRDLMEPVKAYKRVHVPQASSKLSVFLFLFFLFLSLFREHISDDSGDKNDASTHSKADTAVSEEAGGVGAYLGLRWTLFHGTMPSWTLSMICRSVREPQGVLKRFRGGRVRCMPPAQPDSEQQVGEAEEERRGAGAYSENGVSGA